MQKILLPPKEDLENLLFEKLWSKRKVASHYEVSLPTLFNWMKQYDLVGKITPQLQAKKRAITNAAKPKKYDFNKLLKRAIKGEVIKVPGFNSDFLEEYLDEKYGQYGDDDYTEEEFTQDNVQQEN